MALPDIEISVNGYCTLSDVQLFSPQREFLSTGCPNTTQVAQYIQFKFDDINGMLDSLGYCVPVSSLAATAIAVVGHLNGLGAAVLAEKATQSTGNLEASDHATELERRWWLEWNNLEKGWGELIGAARKADYVHRRDEQHPVGEFDLDANLSESDPEFDKNMEF